MPARTAKYIKQPWLGQPKPELPSTGGTVTTEFRRMDTNTTDVNSFVNAHDLYIFAQNHNALYTKAMRKNILDMVIHIDENAASTPFDYDFCFSQYPATSQSAHYYYYGPVLVTPGTKALYFSIYGLRTPTAPNLYCVAHPMGEPTELAGTNVIDPSTPVGTVERGVSVPLPESKDVETFGGKMVYMVGIAPEQGVTGAAGGPYTVNSSFTRGIITASSMAGENGKILYFNADTEIEPRVVVDSYAGGCTVDKPFNKIPPAGIVANTKGVFQTGVLGFAIYEEARTSFSVKALNPYLDPST